MPDRDPKAANPEPGTVNPPEATAGLQTSAAPVSAARAVIPGNGTPPPLECAPLAYENPVFLNSADGRLIRVMSEYLEPLARFRREQIQDTVVFFGSARFRGREE